MRNRKRMFAAIVAALGLVAAACSSSPRPLPLRRAGARPTPSACSRDITGLAASADGTGESGVKAGVYYAKANGINIKSRTGGHAERQKPSSRRSSWSSRTTCWP